MNKSHAKSLLFVLALCLLASACGNKGPLVKPDQKPAEAEAKP
jgi:predicted small lipoprotein YifL